MLETSDDTPGDRRLEGRKSAEAESYDVWVARHGLDCTDLPYCTASLKQVLIPTRSDRAGKVGGENTEVASDKRSQTLGSASTKISISALLAVCAVLVCSSCGKCRRSEEGVASWSSLVLRSI